MGTPILPQVITSPAIVTWNGKSYYSKAGIRTALRRETFAVETDTHGKIDERMKSLVTEVTLQPDGQMLGAGLAGFFPYGVGNVGASVFTALTGSNLPLVIATKFGGASNTGQTITFPRGALTKMPQMRLKPVDTLFGDMTFTCIGNPTVQPNGSNTWAVLADSAFGDASFDETSIITDSYAAAYGSSPYNAMGSMTGFEVNLNMETEDIMADDWGVVDKIIKSLTATASFTPSNLTEAQLYAILNAQGAAYVFPGQSLAKANTNFVLTGSGNGAHTLAVTIYNAGPKNAGFEYSTAKHRFQAVEFTSKRTWTSGAANPLWALTLT